MVGTDEEGCDVFQPHAAAQELVWVSGRYLSLARVIMPNKKDGETGGEQVNSVSKGMIIMPRDLNWVQRERT